MTGPKKKTAIPFWATIFTLMGVIVLCALGTWQLHRLEWKETLIAKLDAAYESGGTQLLDLDKNFAYGRVQGLFLPDKAILIGPKTRSGKIGNHLIVPLQLDGQILLVDMGWTDAKLEDLPIHHLRGRSVTFTGLLRAPQWNMFTPENNPAENLWHKPDPLEIARAKGLENPLPRILYAESANYKFDAAFPKNARQYPPNDHLQYAIFWFTMAVVLVAVYVLRFFRKN